MRMARGRSEDCGADEGMSKRPTDPWLFTPGPINTAEATKRAMLRDFGSRDAEFTAITRRIRARLLDIAKAGATHSCVPLAGSGTFAVEAALGTLVPRGGKLLILVNGVYGRRMASMCERMGRPFAVLETGETVPPDARDVARALDANPAITHVALVHCETTSGILNPLEEIAAVVADAGRGLLVDAMSTFGILPLSAAAIPYDALIASSNKCLEGVPGLAFVIARQAALEAAAGNAPSLSLDLHDQWQFLERTGQWRFTPPTQVAAALDRALDDFLAEGGREGRLARYRRNCAVLIEGMRKLGFVPLVAEALQAPVIVTFPAPADPAFRFEDFYERLRRRGFVIYPGKLTKAETFRIGCIGRLHEEQMAGVVAAVGEVLRETGLRRAGA
jgi:2-aminoethylphosphonate-pyruvate transaminase